MVEAYFYHRPFYGHGMEMTVLLSRWAVEGCSEAIFAKLSGQCLTHGQVLIMSSSIPLLLLLLLLLLLIIIRLTSDAWAMLGLEDLNKTGCPA